MSFREYFQHKVVPIFQRPLFPKRLFHVAIVVLGIAGFFLMVFRAPGDPDFGWHLRTGQEILTRHAIPRVDWFSHTFSSFAWVDHEYASNVLIALLQQYGGNFGPSIFFDLTLLFTLVILLGEATLKKVPVVLRVVFGLLLVPVFVPFLGVRPQVLSWLFFVLVLVVVARMKRRPSSRAYLALPPLFIMWANFHGGSVAIGLILLGVIVAIEGVKVWYFLEGDENMYLSKKRTLTLSAYIKTAAAAVVSIPATLLNPYGYGIYVELLRTISDSYSAGIIREWLSPNFKEYTGLMLLIVLFVVLQLLYLQYKRKVDFTQFVLLLIFLFLALQSVRHIPLFALVVSPLLLENLSEPYTLYVEPVLRIWWVGLVAAALFILFILWQVPFLNEFALTQKPESLAYAGNYPFAAVEYLHRHHLKGEMFNNYNWGGYLIQQLPEYKVFIDGRMPHWRTSDLHLFKEYNSILNVDAGFEQKLHSYHVGFVVIPNGSTFAAVLQLLPNWHEVFRDSTALIFVNTEVNNAGTETGTTIVE